MLELKLKGLEEKAGVIRNFLNEEMNWIQEAKELRDQIQTQNRQLKLLKNVSDSSKLSLNASPFVQASEDTEASLMVNPQKENASPKKVMFAADVVHKKPVVSKTYLLFC